ncbi:MAG TPA: glycine cleavage T C-terminal barrel domain-containing protein [Thermoanaerobaculia bacterium]|jgi:folate-binding protein YgfZ|nr:glycine cleavage T C-terminal barrel domain-containing protein [Thermoanaerobaculia bacterium]
MTTTSKITEEYRAFREGCGLASRVSVGRLEVLGADRLRFLNAYVTCDVKGLVPGEGAYGFFTNPKGGILSDAVVLVLEDRLWLQLPPGQEQAIASHLRKYILADRVEVRGLEDMQLLFLVGPGATDALGRAEGTEMPPPGDWRHVRARVHGTEVELQRAGRMGAEAWALWVSASIKNPLVETLLEVPGVTPVGSEALEILRVEAGIPRFGRDFGPESFPQETGAEEAVSYTKGCYLGQEVVARIHYRGGVQKTLRGLVFETAPAPGTPLLFEGREVGTVTSAVDSIALGRPAGLAILHRRGAEPGTRLDLPDGGTAKVRELPFV